jgi:hypothetical protein
VIAHQQLTAYGDSLFAREVFVVPMLDFFFVGSVERFGVDGLLGWIVVGRL